ncbi:hypothetical protein [Streptomyces sp. PvR034]|uniref:hypothetical protein n=1 Tax=Streptomyces sp. PvR034 TaxID=3156401 RepID=UPI0033950941
MKARAHLLHLRGLLTLALNTAEPLLTGRYGRARLDTVAPLLLGWGHVGSAHFHTAAYLDDANTATPAPLAHRSANAHLGGRSRDGCPNP